METGKARKCAALRRIAGRQHGVVTRDQAAAAGFSASAMARSVERGEWRRLHRGVFAVDPSFDPVLSDVMGALLRAQGRTWASHRTAAALWGMRDETPPRPEVSTTANLRGGRALIHRVPSMPFEDRSIPLALPVTSPERTLVDLGATASVIELEAATVAALQKNLTTIDRLKGRARDLSEHGRPGSGVLSRIIGGWERTAPPASLLEAKLLRLIRAHGLPDPVAQHEVRERGRLLGRIDFAYPQHMVAVEADGYRWHSGRDRWRQDLSRRNALTQLGWRVLHFTWDDVHQHPRHVAETIATAISGRNVPENGTKRHEIPR